jgi:GNAT superfamily N-acetyltransferase
MKIELLRDYTEFTDELANLFYNEWHHLNPQLPFSEWKSGILNRANGNIVPTTIIAIDNGELLGSASLIKNDMKTRLELSPWLAGVYVKQEYRRRGIGKNLIQEIENISEQLVIETL